MKQKESKGLFRLLAIAGEKKGLLLLAGVLSAGSAVCMLVPYWAVYEILRELLTHYGDLAAADAAFMRRCGWAAAGGLVGGLLLLYASLMASHVAAYRILYGLRVRLSAHIGRLPLGYLHGTTTGAVKKTLEQNVEKIENFVAHTIPDLVNVLATVAVMFALFFSLSGVLSAACLVVIGGSIALQFATFMGKRARGFVRIYYDAQEQMGGLAVEYVRGLPVVKVFGQSVRAFRRFHAAVEAYKTYALQVCDAYQSGMVAFSVALNSVLTVVLPVGLVCWEGGASGLAFASVWLFFMVMGPVVSSPVYKLMYLGSSTREIDEGVMRIDRILRREPLPEPVAPREPVSFDVTFSHVSFAYENEEQATRMEVLRDVSFTAGQGKTTALVGPSGGGKSTMAHLVPRFWDVGTGAIQIGGVDVRDIASERLMQLVSFVFQDSFLLHDTLYENIAVGAPGATRENVEAAARAAQCHDFITALPAGYDTKVGEGGVYLSGGEAQRVCVARAILKNAPILVLDEATAFADPENEHKMQQALRSLVRDKTVIVIAHRLSSVYDADKIVVLDQGRVVQCGRHDELVSAPGTYQKMWEAYVRASRWHFQVKPSHS